MTKTLNITVEIEESKFEYVQSQINSILSQHLNSSDNIPSSLEFNSTTNQYVYTPAKKQNNSSIRIVTPRFRIKRDND